ncbi:uncharacterized protein LOC132708237 [Cylas formicarius]|uniref:uncharacterized protein LOC132708237 n=1 Tax=Cylas formicarius TaxID=197179 RepID=UPI002958A982|nr:uncharacterized protein LOC132708237 [Cylas formicarius]
MLAHAFQKLAWLFLVYQNLADCDDFLQFYRPKSDLPQELNEFLASVQQHKQDFAYIKDYAKKQKAYDDHLKETHSLFDEDVGYGESALEDGKKSHGYSSLDDVPNNDIYPFMYQTNMENKYPNERYSKYLHSPIRLRRDVESNYANNGLGGRLKRNSETLKTEKNDYLKNSKRGVQINIKDYGQKLDKTDEDYSDPKSVVLNIEPVGSSDAKNSFSAGAATDEEKQMGPNFAISVANMAQKHTDREESNKLSQRINNVARQPEVYRGDRNSNHQNRRYQVGNDKADYDKVEGVILDGANKGTAKETVNDNKISNKRQLDLKQHENDGLAFLNLQPLDATTISFEQVEPADHLVFNLGDDSDQRNKYVEPSNQNEEETRLKSNDLEKNTFQSMQAVEYSKDGNRELSDDLEEERDDDTYVIAYDDENDFEEVEIKPSRFVELGHNSKNNLFDTYENSRWNNVRNKFKMEQRADRRNNLYGKVRDLPTQRRVVLNRPLAFNELNDLIANPQANREPRRGAHVRKGKKKSEHRHSKKKTRKGKRRKQKCYASEDDAILDDFIPAFHKRSLKAVESMYDAYLGDFGEQDAIENIDHAEFDQKLNADVEGEIENELEFPSEYEIDDDDKDYNYAVVKSMEFPDANSLHNNDQEPGLSDVVNVDRRTKKKETAKGTTKKPTKKTKRPVTDKKKNEYRNSQSDRNPIPSDIFSEDGHQGLSSVTHIRGRTMKKSKPKPKKVLKATTTEAKRTKSLTDEEKQALLLKFNNGFQRWPRFVLEDKKYKKRLGSLSPNERFANLYIPQKDNYFVRSPTSDRIKRVTNEKQETIAGRKSAKQFAHEMDSAEVEQEPVVNKREDTKNITRADQRLQTTTRTVFDLNIRENVTIDPMILATATFPNVVQEVLNNVNDDVLDQKTRAEVDVVESASTSQLLATSAAAPFRFPTDSQYDEEEGCVTYRPVRVTSICQDPLPGQSPSTVTTMLALVNESSYSVNQTKAEYLDLNDILGGNLPKQIVNEIWSEARRSIRKGLRAGPFNLNLELSNYNSSAETSQILNEMTKLIFQLQRSTSCQQLPVSLKNYISEITGNPKDDILNKLKEMNDIDFDDYQGAYMFHADQSDKLEGKVEVLKSLLNRYNNLPADCKERAEPVKEYIEKHLGMVNTMLENGKNGNSSEKQHKSKKLRDVNRRRKKFEGKHSKTFKEDDFLREKLIKKQLEEVGLGENQRFSPMFSIDELVENNKNKSKPRARASKKRVGKRQINTSTSTQYGKLADAVRQLNNKREKQQRIQAMYGRKDNVDDEDHNEEKAGFDSAMACSRNPETSKTKRILETTEMKTVRRIAEKILMDKERNEDIRQVFRVDNINDWVLHIKIKWNEHIDRMAEERIVTKEP